MNGKIINLQPLAEIGSGICHVTDKSIEIEIKGINGALKAWLIGGEAQPIGNIVDSKLKKEIDTTKNSGILITQSGRQMLIGSYSDKKFPPNIKEKAEKNDDVPFENYGFEWKRINSKKFATNNILLKYILSNKSVYESFKKYGHYFIGDSEGSLALAIPCREDEKNPLCFLGEMNKYIRGYRIVCIDEKTGKLYIPE